MIPFLARLDDERARCSDPFLRAEIDAERAGYLARVGEFSEASRIVAALRSEFGDGRSARISIHLMLVEGLLLFYQRIDSGARDRILRAHVLSEAGHFDDLICLTASWLAHVEFNRSDFQAMCKALKRCTRSKVIEKLPWSSRLFLVLADCHMYSRRVAGAKSWYQKARQSAIDFGDEATLGAMIYNKAALGLAQLRVAGLDGKVDAEVLQFISMEVGSAYNYQRGAQHLALTQLMDVCRSRVFLMQGRFREALDILEELCSANKISLGFRSERIILLVERAQCLLRLGATEEARIQFDAIDPQLAAGLACDDRFVFVEMYIRLAGELDCLENTKRLLGVRARYRQDYEEELAELGAVLDELQIEIP